MVFNDGRQLDTDKYEIIVLILHVTRFMTIARPQANGETEFTNKQILNGIKKRLDDAKWMWACELRAIL